MKDSSERAQASFSRKYILVGPRRVGGLGEPRSIGKAHFLHPGPQWRHSHHEIKGMKQGSLNYLWRQKILPKGYIGSEATAIQLDADLPLGRIQSAGSEL